MTQINTNYPLSIYNLMIVLQMLFSTVRKITSTTIQAHKTWHVADEKWAKGQSQLKQSVIVFWCSAKPFIFQMLNWNTHNMSLALGSLLSSL